MLTKRIIPCLDVKDGKVVKGVKFKNHKVMGDIVDLPKNILRLELMNLSFMILLLVQRVELRTSPGLNK